MGLSCNFSKNGKKKRLSSKSKISSIKTFKKQNPNLTAWVSTPMYLRGYYYNINSYEYDLGVEKGLIIRVNNNQNNFNLNYERMINIIEKGTNQSGAEIKEIWRFLDTSLKKDEDLNESKTFDLMNTLISLAQENESKRIKDIQEEINRLYCDPDYCLFNKAEKIKELKKQELEDGGVEALFSTAFSSYQPRDVTKSNNYVPNVLITRVYNSIICTLKDSEKKLVDWVEENSPGATRKFLSAIINQSKFISINYLLPLRTIITSGEQQKFFRYRKMILNKVGIVTSKIGVPGVSSSLMYSENALNFLDSIIPGYKKSGISTLLDEIKEKKKLLNIDLGHRNDLTDTIIELQCMMQKYKKQNNIFMCNVTKRKLEEITTNFNKFLSRDQLLALFEKLKELEKERSEVFLSLISLVNT